MFDQTQSLAALEQKLADVRKAINKGVPGTLEKAFTQSATATSGITMYSLEEGARLLYPITTILRNMIPRRVGGQGIQANWRSITAVNPSLVSIGNEEGKRGGIMDQTVTDNLAKFAFLGLDNYVTWEAQYAGEGFDDVLSLATTTLLQGCMEREERVILGGNSTTGLGNTGSITASGSATGGTLAHATYHLGCVALTYEGVINSTPAALVASGNAVVKLPYTRNNADGTTTNISGFTANPSADQSVVVPSTSSAGSIVASVTPVKGAWGYAWYIGSANNNQKLVAITGISTVLITATAPSSNQLFSALPGSDSSRDTLVFDGLVAQAYAGGGYVTQLGNGTGGAGTHLTSGGSGSGSIAEFDTAIAQFINAYRLVPTHIIMSAADAKNVKALILNGNTNAAPFFIGEDGQLRGGAQWKRYTNPVGFGNPELEIVVHPLMPQGTILFYSDRVPYALTNVQDIVKMHLRRDYQAVRWPVVTKQYPIGVYFDGVLQHYFPAALGIISNIAP